LSHSDSPFFMMGFFKIGSWELFARGQIQTTVLLIFDSWVARITGVRHWHLAIIYYCYYCCCFAMVGIVLRASYFLGRCFIIWATCLVKIFY
jgi:hypothetical protein